MPYQFRLQDPDWFLKRKTVLFNSLHYCIFLPIVTLLYFAVPKKFKNPLLLSASYYFYMSWMPEYAVLILFSTITTYLSAYFLDWSDNVFWRKVSLGANIVVNLLILVAFKYYGFLADIVLFATDLLGTPVTMAASTLLLPVGISFYTFQSLGYSIDVYRKNLRHETNFFDYALFVSFFPQLVAGPIERAANLLPQFKNHAAFDYDRVVSGMRRILIGMMKKVVIADNLSIYVDAVYADIPGHGGLTCIVATLAFSLQIYCDFSGYSDIAVGSAKILGYNLMENFKSPYFSTSIREFWSRWHISLSTWFKDYLYIPLGGNRKGGWRKYINFLITFTVSGLWHGANITFVIWGFIHGLLRTGEALAADFGITAPKKAASPLYLTALKILATYTLVCMAWVFFRAETLADAFAVYEQIFTNMSASTFSPEMRAAVSKSLAVSISLIWRFMAFSTIAAIVILLVMEILAARGANECDAGAYLAARPMVQRWALYFIIAILAITSFSLQNTAYSGVQHQFIYFQF